MMMRLRRHAVAEMARVEEAERLRKLFGSRDKWVEVVNVFFKHVESRFLASLIADGLVTTSRMEAVGHGARVPEPPTFIVAFGHTAVRFSPLFSPTLTSLGVIEVTSRSAQEKTGYFVCDLTRGWLAPAQDTGLRGALSDYLPENLVLLDEDLFDRTLSRLIENREAIITYDKDKVLERFSYMLNDILDPARKRAVAAFISQLGSYPLIGDVRSLGRALRTSLTQRLAAPENRAQRFLPRPRDDQADNQPAKG